MCLKKVDNSGFLSNTISVLDLNDAILLILQVSFFWWKFPIFFGKYTVCMFTMCLTSLTGNYDDRNNLMPIWHNNRAAHKHSSQESRINLHFLLCHGHRYRETSYEYGSNVKFSFLQTKISRSGPWTHTVLSRSPKSYQLCHWDIY